MSIGMMDIVSRVEFELMWKNVRWAPKCFGGTTRGWRSFVVRRDVCRRFWRWGEAPRVCSGLLGIRWHSALDAPLRTAVR